LATELFDDAIVCNILANGDAKSAFGAMLEVSGLTPSMRKPVSVKPFLSFSLFLLCSSNAIIGPS
jgi:hypothetical protein